jgi:hypothetical protein
MRCWTRDCENLAVPERRYCSKCKKRKYREKYPLKYIYDTIKMNAKRRRKEFTLTFDEFECFCRRTGYDKFKGITADCLSIDRIKNSEGYHVWNIQAITVSKNSKKKFDDSVKPDDNCPF